ncbi:MAG: hypothetical protein ACREOM_00945 [Candidatus Dormibacteraceae bacterium]
MAGLMSALALVLAGTAVTVVGILLWAANTSLVKYEDAISPT